MTKRTHAIYISVTSGLMLAELHAALRLCITVPWSADSGENQTNVKISIYNS